MASAPSSVGVDVADGGAADRGLGRRRPRGRGAEAEQADAAALDAVVVIELEGDGGAGDGEVAVAPGELLARRSRTDPATRGGPTPVSSSSSPRAVLHMPVKKSADGHRPAAGGREHLELGVEGQGDGGVLGGGSAWAMRAADRAAVADLEVPDERRGPGEERHGVGHLGRALDRRLGRAGADPTSRRCVARCPRSSSIRPRSTRWSKAASRRASIGMRLWPPASTLAPSPSSASSATASAGGRGRVVLERGGLHRRSAPCTSVDDGRRGSAAAG